MQFWISFIHTGNQGDGPWSMDRLFSWNVRFLLICSTQDELETLQGYMLVYGRKIEIDTFDNWKKRAKESRRHDYSLGGYTEPILRMPPIVVSTFKPKPGEFHGL